MTELVLTAKVRLYTSTSDDLKLAETCEQYRRACDFVSDWVFEHGFELNSNKLHEFLYQEIRQKFGLKSQLAASTMKTVTARYQTVQTQLAKKPYKYKDESGKWRKIKRTLDWLMKPIKFKRPQADLVRNRDFSFKQDGEILSLNTLQGRIEVYFEHPLLDQFQADGWLWGGGKLVKLNGIWYFHLSVKKNIDELAFKEVKHVVGLDRGLRQLVTSYDEKGVTTFYSGKTARQTRNKYDSLRQSLQSRHTKSSKRRLRKIGQRENRWMTDVNHQLSKTLVDKYGAKTLFVIEDLTDVSFEVENCSKKQRHENRSWAFYQLEQFLTYKALKAHSAVVQVGAEYTSQRCPKCGRIDKEQRSHILHEYHCQCGYTSNDDRVGAMNIQLLGTLYHSDNLKPHFEKLTVSA